MLHAHLHKISAVQCNRGLHPMEQLVKCGPMRWVTEGFESQEGFGQLATSRCLREG